VQILYGLLAVYSAKHEDTSADDSLFLILKIS